MVANFWISRKLRLASASLPPAAAVRHWATTVMQWWNCDKDQVPRRLSRWDAGVRSAKQPRDRQVAPGSIEPKEAGLLPFSSLREFDRSGKLSIFRVVASSCQNSPHA